MFGIDDIISVGMKVLDKVIPDPEQKAKAQLDLQTLAQQGELAHIMLKLLQVPIQQD